MPDNEVEEEQADQNSFQGKYAYPAVRWKYARKNYKGYPDK